MKKKILLTGMALALGIATLAGVGHYYSTHQDDDIVLSDNANTVDVSNLPVYAMKADFIYDSDSINESVGIVDYVFLGKVVANKGTSYEDIVVTEDEDGNPVEIGTPYTKYSVQVKENIKGELLSDSTIEIKKHGGVAQDNKSVILFDDDSLPEVGKQYVFLAYAQPDGSLLVSGPNSNILNNDTSSTDSVVEKYEDAIKNEVTDVDRERYTSKYEEN